MNKIFWTLKMLDDADASPINDLRHNMTFTSLDDAINFAKNVAKSCDPCTILVVNSLTHKDDFSIFVQ